jgi:hypothetical protein
LNALTPVVEKLAELGQKVLPYVEQALEPLSKILLDVTDAVVQFFRAFAKSQTVQEGLDQLASWWQLYGPEIKAIATDLFTEMSRLMKGAGSDLMVYLLGAFRSFVIFIITNGPLIVGLIGFIAQAIISGFSFAAMMLQGFYNNLLMLQFVFQQMVTIIMMIINGQWRTAWATMLNIVKSVPIVGTISTIGQNTSAAIGAAAAMMVAIWRRAFDIMVTYLSTVIGKIKSKVKAFVAVGVAIVQGMEQGIKDAFNGLIATFEGLIDLLPEEVKKILGIASPSKVFAGLGKNIMQGLSVGIDKTAGLPQQSLSNASRDMASGFQKQVNNTSNYMYGVFNVQSSGGAMDITGVR